MFDALKRWLSGQKPKPQGKRPVIDACPDCRVRSGELHELFCTRERCPFCNGQLITCGCIRSVLELSEPERQALDEYIDDSVPPLSGIMERWREALARKGRVPFEAVADTPMRAAYRGDVAALQRFMEDGFPPNEGNEVGYTALMAAARGERLEAIRFLLSHGAQAALADKRGCSALHWVVAQQPAGDAAVQVACLRALLDAGADLNAPNEDGLTPLMNAAWFGCRDSVVELLRRGADPLRRDRDGKRAKEFAFERGHKDVAELLG